MITFRLKGGDKMNKNTIIGVAIGFFIIVGLVAFMGSTEDQFQPYDVEPALPQSEKTEDVYVQDNATFKNEFMVNCALNESYRAYCECTYNELTERYTYNELLIIAGKIDEDKMPQELINATAQCIDRL